MAALCGAVAYLAYPTTIFAFAVWAWLLSRHPAATVTPFALLVPVAGIIGSAFFLGEIMMPVEAIGGAIIVLGLAFNVFGLRLFGRRRDRLSGPQRTKPKPRIPNAIRNIATKTFRKRGRHDRRIPRMMASSGRRFLRLKENIHRVLGLVFRWKALALVSSHFPDANRWPTSLDKC